MYLTSEHNLFKNLKILKEKFSIQGIKAEFEAEGSNQFDIYKLRSLTNKLDIKLYIKIGGVEAVNDIYFCVEVGADGIIAPMVESKFALRKFLDSINKLKLRKKPHLSINIETINAVNKIEEIIKLAKGNINNITIGRSDLSSSYFKDNISQNSLIIENKIFLVSKKAVQSRLTCTVGGGIDMNTIKLYRNNKNIKLVNKLETRKVIFLKSTMLRNFNALNAALDFEKNYVLYKKEINNLKLKSEISRLTKLQTRR